MTHFAMPQQRIFLSLCAAGILICANTNPAVSQTTPEHSSPTMPASKEESSHSRAMAEIERYQTSSVDRAYKLKYASTPQDSNEILTGLRNMLPPITRIFLVPSTSMIVVHAPEDTQATVLKLLNELDVPHPRYRLTYTLTELDGSRKIGVQHFSMVVVSGQRSQLKQGSRLPISTGGGQFTYLDVGMNFDVTLQEIQGGAVLKERVEQSSIAPDNAMAQGSNPLLRQTQLEGTTSLTLGKPQLVGSLDVPSSTHHFDVEVVMEPMN